MKASILSVAAMLAVAGVLVGPPLVGHGSAIAACDTGTRVDGSTADDAKRKFEKAGYRQVKALKKGCDSYWHAMAVKDGKETRLVLAPTGEITPEND